MATAITAAVARTYAPARAADGHKGTFGHVLVVAGAPGYTGAACLAAEAAARSGVGRVTLACPAGLNPIFEVKLTEVMTLAVPQSAEQTFAPVSVERVVQAVAHCDAVGLGPGLSRHAETTAFVADLLPQLTVPVVIDADGLSAVADRIDVLLPTAAPCVLTPHPGEMARLTGLTAGAIQQDREGVATRYAQRWQCTVLLKGAQTIVAAPDGDTWVNTTGNHGLASGGTGDVLTGLIAGLLAQGCGPAAAAALGAYLHGWAGDAVAARGNPRALIAGDLIAELPATWRALLGAEVDPPS